MKTIKTTALILGAAFLALTFPACLKKAPEAPAVDEPPYSLEGFYQQLDQYIERFHDPAHPYNPRDLRGNFSYQPGKATDLYGSTDFVYVLWVIGELDERTTPEGRSEWAELIMSYQNPETGWFDRGNETSHFKSHATAYATGALALLGEKPAHPFYWKSRMTASEKAMRKWIEQIWWDVVWVGSHEGGGVAASLAMTGEADDRWFEWYLDWLDREANPKTGLWQRAFYNTLIEKPNMNDMGGAAHFWWIYQWRARPVPYPEKVIDTVLSLQLDSGLWDKKTFKGDKPYCIDLDAINGINLAYFQLAAEGNEYRRDDIARAFHRYLGTATGALSAPGGLDRLYGNSHDLPGALIAVAEADKFFREVTGKSVLETRQEWRTVLGEICWL